MDYEQMVGPQMPPAQPAASHAALQSNEPSQFMASIQKPAQSPEEFQQRQGLWAEIVQRVNTDPNLRQAMLMMGTQLAQPIPAGQNVVGHAFDALGTGAAAYNAGEFSKWQQGQAEAESARRTAESKANVQRTGAETEATQEATALARGTRQLKIDQLLSQVEQSKLTLQKAEKEENVAAIERDLRARKARIASEVPDAQIRAQIEAEIEKGLLGVKEARARIARDESAAEFTRSKTAMEQKEIEGLQNLSPDQLREYFTKSGSYSTSALSGVVQQGNFWGKIYDKLPADDADKQGRTKEQYMAYMLKKATDKNRIEILTKALQNVSDPALQDELEAMLKAEVVRMRRENETKGGKGGDSGAKETVKEQVLTNGMKMRIHYDANGKEVKRELIPGNVPGSSGGPQP